MYILVISIVDYSRFWTWNISASQSIATFLENKVHGDNTKKTDEWQWQPQPLNMNWYLWNLQYTDVSEDVPVNGILVIGRLDQSIGDIR